MKDRKDYIDLRETTENIGNGPPPVPPTPMYMPPPERKGNVLVVIAIVVSALFVFAVVVTALIGVVSFRAISEQVHNQMATEILMSDMVELHDFERRIEAWAMDLEDNIVTWVDEFVDEMLIATEITSFIGNQLINEFWADAQLIDTISIDLSENVFVNVVTHSNYWHIRFDGGDHSFWLDMDIQTGVISIWDDFDFGQGTLTLWMPRDWQGVVNIISAGEVFVSGDLPDSVVNYGNTNDT